MQVLSKTEKRKTNKPAFGVRGYALDKDERTSQPVTAMKMVIEVRQRRILVG